MERPASISKGWIVLEEVTDETPEDTSPDDIFKPPLSIALYTDPEV